MLDSRNFPAHRNTEKSKFIVSKNANTPSLMYQSSFNQFFEIFFFRSYYSSSLSLFAERAFLTVKKKVLKIKTRNEKKKESVTRTRKDPLDPPGNCFNRWSISSCGGGSPKKKMNRRRNDGKSWAVTSGFSEKHFFDVVITESLVLQNRGATRGTKEETIRPYFRNSNANRIVAWRRYVQQISTKQVCASGFRSVGIHSRNTWGKN